MIEDVVIDPNESDIVVLAGSVSRLADAFTLQIEEDRKARAVQAEKDRIADRDRERRLRRGRRQWYVFITAVMAILLFAVVWYGRTNNNATTANNRAAATSQLALARILDCSTPGGTCYKAKAAATLANNEAIVRGLDTDNQKAVVQIEQAICNLHPEFCPSGFTPKPPK